MLKLKGNLVHWYLLRLRILYDTSPQHTALRAIVLFQSRSPSATFAGENKNVVSGGEKQQDPEHCPAPANVTTLAEEGTCSGLQSTADWCPRWSRCRMRWQWLSAIHCPCVLPEPSDLPEVALTGWRGIRLRYARSSGASVRRIGFRRGYPSHCSLRVE